MKKINIIFLATLPFLFSLCKTAQPLTADHSKTSDTMTVVIDSIVIPPPPDTVEIAAHPLPDSIKYVIRTGTFLGSEKRNYYGNKAPANLDVVWKLYLGEGQTRVGKTIKDWAGAGWTGQPLLVEENGQKYLIQGAYDHKLKKIAVDSPKIVWEYAFDDVIKGTGTIWENKNARFFKDRLLILQGSRHGFNNDFYIDVIPSYRAISYFTGKELWRLNSRLTKSYSRDVDASALIIKDTAYIGLENGVFTKFNPSPSRADTVDGIFQPEILSEHMLYESKDVVNHKRNVVTEASPSRIGKKLYLASGSGHVYGYDMERDTLIWDFFIGSDIDGSAIVTEDSCLLISVEKQYIQGKGGIYKLDPAKPPANAVVWYKPVEDKETAGWEGGVIGSVGINDATRPEGFSKLAAFAAIDGYLYVVKYNSFSRNLKGDIIKSKGPDGQTFHPEPEEVFKVRIGTSISTPIFVGNKLIVAGYGGLFLFEYDARNNFKQLDKLNTYFESTPIAVDGKIYIASRDGYLYCLGSP
ncbi:MAG: hypothetical protein OEX02_12390 [Cyclobacteriaceae bacterium]|nr:hypothetical protein [Cyclobacteriaceae bacterium]